MSRVSEPRHVPVSHVTRECVISPLTMMSLTIRSRMWKLHSKPHELLVCWIFSSCSIKDALLKIQQTVRCLFVVLVPILKRCFDKSAIYELKTLVLGTCTPVLQMSRISEPCPVSVSHGYIYSHIRTHIHIHTHIFTDIHIHTHICSVQIYPLYT